ncbi:Concanavalin A-like lectin/glucanase [Cordyceps fumosorosea ARSEF 2679]|uniref:Concanavalin A-like lectin/glucanase n=1 Tax=Cordyceps fumosorosea (strain ARSEF 2679) TaxID=1081104 RepID=A0A162I6U8_CORFA|nr:Concanavalin A-like lectin/glucanase [Cordyceps fumosorosea ARSEF 2679]OAA53085.1 Concanavalin A-like lectin/glucanase [Cordyceps fumosorosea ARSEF 2679]
MIFAVILSALAAVTASPAGEIATPTVSPAGGLATRSLEARTTYVPGWCGQVLNGSSFNEVGATWTVPTSSPRSSQNRTYAYQWVGIDGGLDQNCLTLLQAGTYYKLDDGPGTYGFWYEFLPADPVLLDSPTEVKPGDEVFVKVTATSNTAGTAYMENKTTGKSFSVDMKAPKGSRLCQSYVEWIQENPDMKYDTMAPFSEFSFYNAYASDTNGNSYNLKNSEDWVMKIGDSTLCYPSNLTDTSVTIKYSGPV